jgi:hypothetical protein
MKRNNYQITHKIRVDENFIKGKIIPHWIYKIIKEGCPWKQN